MAMAKRLGWFRKMHKEEEHALEESETKEGGKPETMAKRLRWFERLQRYNQRRLRKFGGFVPLWRWKRPSLLRVSTFFDDLAFRFLYFLEAVVLVSAFCCFFLCCGCHV